MANSFLYKIEINLSKSGDQVHEFAIEEPSTQKKIYYSFYKTKTTIECHKSNKYKEDDIFDNSQNHLHVYIERALMGLFLINSDTRVKSIKVIRKLTKGDEVICEKKFPKDCLPLPKNISHSLNPAFLKKLLDYDDISDKYRLILSHWIQGNLSSNAYDKFEHLWRAFERIAMYSNRNNSAPNKEATAMRTLSSFIGTNKNYFSKSLLRCDTLDIETIRKLNWQLYTRSELSKVNGNVNVYTDTVFYKVMVNSFTDDRLIDLMHHTLHYVKRKLGTYHNNVFLDINNKQKGIRENTDVLRIILCNYAYYYRCKVFHGEIFDRKVFLPVKKDNAIERVNLLNELLDLFVIDALNSLDKF